MLPGAIAEERGGETGSRGSNTDPGGGRRRRGEGFNICRQVRERRRRR